MPAPETDWRRRRAEYLALAGRWAEIDAEGLEYLLPPGQVPPERYPERWDRLRLRREQLPLPRRRVVSR